MFACEVIATYIPHRDLHPTSNHSHLTPRKIWHCIGSKCTDPLFSKTQTHTKTPSRYMLQVRAEGIYNLYLFNDQMEVLMEHYSKDRSSPFFLYYAMGNLHEPLQVLHEKLKYATCITQLRMPLSCMCACMAKRVRTPDNDAICFAAHILWYIHTPMPLRFLKKRWPGTVSSLPRLEILNAVSSRA